MIAHEKFVFDKTQQHVVPSKLFQIVNKFFRSNKPAIGSQVLRKCYGSTVEQNEESSDLLILYHAVVNGAIELIDEVITHHGADRHWRNHDHETLCHISIRDRKSNVFALLVNKFGLYREARDEFQRTPLQLFLSEKLIPSTCFGLIETRSIFRAVRALLTGYSLKLGTKDINGRTPLMNIIATVNTQRLVKKGPPASNRYFHAIYSSTWYDFVSILIRKHHADCTSQDNDGDTLLSLCVVTIPNEESNAFVRKLLRFPGVIVNDRVLEAAKPYFERPRPPLCETLVEMLEAKVAEQERGDLSNDRSQDTDTAAKG